jgi:hypothetical protein
MNTVSEIGTPGSSVKSADRCLDLLELFAATTSDLTLS